MHEPSAMLRIAPEDNVLVGAQRILHYLGISSITTLYDWIEDGALPCIKRPDGKWMTTMTAIDTWIFQAASLIQEKQQSTLALRSDEKLAASQQNTQNALAAKKMRIAVRAGRGVGLLPGRRHPKSPYTPHMPTRRRRALANSDSLSEFRTKHDGPTTEVLLDYAREVGTLDIDGNIINRRPATSADAKRLRDAPHESQSND